MAKERVFDRLGSIKAPDPGKDQISWMSSGVHIHRSPDDGEGVSPYYGMGANWMFLGYLGRPSSLALTDSWSRRRTTLISIPGQTQLVRLVRQSV